MSPSLTARNMASRIGSWSDLLTTNQLDRPSGNSRQQQVLCLLLDNNNTSKGEEESSL